MSNTTGLTKSVHLHTQAIDDGFIVWHSLYGRPVYMSTEAVSFLEKFSQPQVLSDLSSEESEAASTLQELGYIIPDGLDEREDFMQEVLASRLERVTSGELVKNFSLVVTSACNFACSYCIHFASLGHQNVPNLGSCQVMSPETAIAALKGYYERLRLNGATEAVVNFGGGEPLLGFKTIKAAVEWIKQEVGNGFDTKYTINTNASLVTSEIAAFLAENQFSVATSLDGLPEHSDLARTTKDGGPASATILKGIEELQAAGVVVDGVAATMTSSNFPLLDERFIDWGWEQGLVDLRIDLDVIGMFDIPNDVIVEKLSRLRSYGQSIGVEVYGFWTRPAENFNEDPSNSLVAFCGASLGSSICIGPDGNVLPCGYSSESLGHLTTSEPLFGRDTSYTRYVKNRLPGKIAMCHGCEIEAFCAGGCNITRECDDESGRQSARMCDLYRSMTRILLAEQYTG